MRNEGERATFENRRNRKKHGDSWTIGVIYPLFFSHCCMYRSAMGPRQKEPQRKEEKKGNCGLHHGIGMGCME